MCAESGEPGPAAGSHRDLSWYVDSEGRTRLIRTPEQWAARRALILKGFQEAAGRLPSRENLPDLDLQITEDRSFRGVRLLSGTIQAEPGDRLPLDLYLPASAADMPADRLFGSPRTSAVPGILALHPTGAAGRRIVSGEKPNRQYAVELAQRGYVVVAPDYPSFGDYRSWDFRSERYASGTMKGIFNHMRCVDLLCALSAVDADRIGVIGHSLGGHNAIFAAVFDERIDVIVSSCGWTPFHDYYGGKLEGWTSPRYMPRIRTRYGLDPDRVPFDFGELIAALAPRPFVSVSPLHDGNFSVDGVKRTIPKVRQIYDLLGARDAVTLFLPDCGHDFPTDMRLSSYEIIDRVLQFEPLPIEPDYSAELPRIPPTEPDEALKTFQTAPGYEIRPVAREPQVTDPVAAAFDEDGRLFVVEMNGYSEQADENRGRIRLLEDRDQDGTFETSTVYADGFSWPTAIAVYDGGVFVGAAPDILYLKDTDGDGTADRRETVFTGFGKGNVQGLLNSFHWGHDGRIYGATSSSGGEIRTVSRPNDPAVRLRSRDFSFDPRRLDLREETGGAQHGMSFDEYGNRFVCSNSNHAQAIIYNHRYLDANPFVSPAPGRVTIADDGGQAPVFRISPVEPWRIVRTRLRVSGRVRGVVEGGGRPAGYFTGATGITVCRADAWPADMRGCVIIGDVGSNIVHRKKVVPRGVSWTATRIDEKSEFVASTDVWFRPVQFVNAPDGCMYILDMYRETIEHPASLPPEIKRHLDLTSGRDRGRLYRIAPTGYVYRPAPRLSQATIPELVRLLGHPNGWHADTAGRLLYERNDPSTAQHLRRALPQESEPAGIVRILSLLDHFEQLDDRLLESFVQHSHPRVRERAVLLTESRLDNPALLTAVCRRVQDDDARVRLQAAFSLSRTDSAARVAPLVELLRTEGQDPWLRTAALTSLKDQVWSAVVSLTGNEEFLRSSSAAAILAEAVAVALKRPDAPGPDSVMAAVEQAGASRRLQRDLLRLILELRKDWKQHDSTVTLTRTIVAAARSVLESTDANAEQRADAVPALSLSSWSEQKTHLTELLAPEQPPIVQAAAMQTVAEFSDPDAAAELIRRWETFSPSVRKLALTALLSRTTWTERLLNAIADGQVAASVLSTGDLNRLTQHASPSVREAAEKLLAAAATSTRQDVVNAYRPALVMTGDPERGAVVFRKTCSVCHQVGDIGFEVGPNLLSVRNRGAEFILLNVLDPNREVLPAWHDYIALTSDGRSSNGIIAQESPVSVTLRQAERKEQKILRSDIELLKDTGRSLMPEDLEKSITVQQMADLLAWLNAQ